MALASSPPPCFTLGLASSTVDAGKGGVAAPCSTVFARSAVVFFCVLSFRTGNDRGGDAAECLDDKDNRAARVAGTRRNPDAAALARELRAIGINLNQIARFQNSTGEREKNPGELDELESLIKQAFRRIIEL
jgi:hypothetical protein